MTNKYRIGKRNKSITHRDTILMWLNIKAYMQADIYNHGEV